MWHFIGVCTVCYDKNQSLEKEILYFFEIITCDPSIYTMDQPDLTVQILWNIPLVLKGLILNVSVNVFERKIWYSSMLNQFDFNTY